ncbi:VWA-like domain-containing protein [Candidatus Dojkabacteria bacterium]|jgi:predicted metal-dependent peptidase|nr:VWA-like domain-containing protein [Candidatus Dojkabacteria bacterium]
MNENLKQVTNKHFGALPITYIELNYLKQREDIHEKLSRAIIEMITSYNLPYYGEFSQFINFWEAKIGTCGVNVTNKGMNFYWDREWIDSRNNREIIFTIVHEIFHLLFSHQKRGVGYDKRIANLAADMIINSIIHGDLIIGEGLSKMIEIPKDKDGNNTVIFLPKEYDGFPIFEDVYAWLLNQYNDYRNKNSHKQTKKDIKVDKDGNITIDGKKYCGKCGQEMKDEKDGKDGQENDGKDSQGKDSQGGKDGQDSGNKCPNCGQEKGQGQQGESDGEGESHSESDGESEGKTPGKGYGQNGKSGENGENSVDMYPIEKFFENIDNNKGQSFDIHFDDDVSEEARKQFVESTMEKLKTRGLQSGTVEKILNKLRKSRKDHLKEIKRNLSNDIFGNKKQKSITKLNRRGIWGLKGQRKFKTKINCILDTSGSMNGEFERVLSYIFQNDIEINLIQCDTEIKSFVSIKQKRELEKMPIKGLGGTTLTPGLQYIASDKNLNKCNNVILTDGYTDSLDFTGVKGNTIILSTSTQCPIFKSNSKIRQIIIDKSQNN